MRVFENSQAGGAGQFGCRGGFLFLGMLSLFFVSSGCQSKQEMDYRPEWIQQADAQLQRAPQSRVTGEGAEVTESSFGGGRREGGIDSGEVTSPPAGAQGKSFSRSTPPGAEWGETRVTVEVEE